MWDFLLFLTLFCSLISWDLPNGSWSDVFSFPETRLLVSHKVCSPENYVLFCSIRDVCRQTQSDYRSKVKNNHSSVPINYSSVPSVFSRHNDPQPSATSAKTPTCFPAPDNGPTSIYIPKVVTFLEKEKQATEDRAAEIFAKFLGEQKCNKLYYPWCMSPSFMWHHCARGSCTKRTKHVQLCSYLTFLETWYLAKDLSLKKKLVVWT